jgi:hypothetical protein
VGWRDDGCWGARMCVRLKPKIRSGPVISEIALQDYVEAKCTTASCYWVEYFLHWISIQSTDSYVDFQYVFTLLH